MKTNNHIIALILLGLVSVYSNCSKTRKPDNSSTNTGGQANQGSGAVIDSWVTTGNQFSLLQKPINPLTFNNPVNEFETIEIDSATRYQTMDGFGYTLTGGSATLISQ